MREIAKALDQRPEEGPAQLVPDDVAGAPERPARKAARRNARSASGRNHGPGDPRQDPTKPRRARSRPT